MAGAVGDVASVLSGGSPSAGGLPVSPARHIKAINIAHKDQLLTPRHKIRFICHLQGHSEVADTYNTLEEDDELRQLYVEAELEDLV